MSLSGDAAGCRIAVSDTGPGIPPCDQLHVFEAFAQLQDLDRKHLPGVGLGLSLVKELVATLEGSIELESEPGSGTTFTVVLPKLDVPSAVAGAH